MSSSISRASQTPCVAVVEAAMYFSSQEDKATTFCLVDCQQIAQTPDNAALIGGVDCRRSADLPQLESSLH